MASTVSVLFLNPSDRVRAEDATQPDFFTDLNLDQIVASIVVGRDEYDLAPFFSVPMKNVEAVDYRHEVLDDLQTGALFAAVESFADQMRAVRLNLSLSEKVYYPHEKERWFLDAARLYCGAVRTLAGQLASAQLTSHGFLSFRDYLAAHIAADTFTNLAADTERLAADLSDVKYSMDIKGDRITVTDYYGESDYSAEVAATFQRFEQGAVKDYLIAFAEPPGMNHVEAAVLQMVAKLNPAVFQALDRFRSEHDGFLDDTLTRFDREVQFYLAYLAHVHRIESAGVQFCCPSVSDRSKEINATATFDLALADKLRDENTPVVCNDFFLNDPERIFVVTGPNNGGKTTFARTFGQLHYLASLGLPVPGSKAQLFLFDRLFTHFEKQEDPTNLHGKLEDDLLRIHGILEQASSNSILVLNEIFTSTTLADAIFLGTKVIEQIMELDSLCVCVTFVDELASLGASTVSTVSTVDAADPAVRTFKIVRKPADGLAYAAAIAEKYGLSYHRLKERISS
ncbi:DNA mismatch repair protein MutS [Parafrigoribacterium mesophilum]|uniref:MutS-related protein n=1 Tax=Parafrigoribacterium mesophilum TaxID=433646 RepID=UPI0031FC3F8C